MSGFAAITLAGTGFPDICATCRAEALAALKASDINCTYFSPPMRINPGVRTGKFRLGGDDLLVDEQRKSWVSFEDYAVALVDELEKPAHAPRQTHGHVNEGRRPITLNASGSSRDATISGHRVVSELPGAMKGRPRAAADGLLTAQKPTITRSHVRDPGSRLFALLRHASMSTLSFLWIARLHGSPHVRHANSGVRNGYRRNSGESCS
ncbi:hypothetical protein [Paraburkholderia sp. CNPSo 3274]|uniref:hypothetical protein n=1 Tax=Paraburkholderia sp. CNPSo 3274 TaxID=2940932 RepID=UPI0035CD06D8